MVLQIAKERMNYCTFNGVVIIDYQELHDETYSFRDTITFARNPDTVVIMYIVYDTFYRQLVLLF